MIPAEAYLTQIRQRLIDDPHVVAYRFLRQRATADAVFLRARVTLVDESILDFATYNEYDETDTLSAVTYSYHWMDVDNRLRRRWDNAPHYPDLSGFPHHIHDGDETNVQPGEPVDLFHILDLIGREIGG